MRRLFWIFFAVTLLGTALLIQYIGSLTGEPHLLLWVIASLIFNMTVLILLGSWFESRRRK